MNNVLVIGKGGREHALAWKLKMSTKVDKVFVAPGNPGMKNVAACVDIKETDFAALAQFAKKENIQLTVVGPDQQVADGIVDYFTQAGLRIWGPTASAARIESSKSFAKDLMRKYNIPTAQYAIFTDLPQAQAYVATANMPIVLKADGLAAGKGVVIAQNTAEAQTALLEMMDAKKFGAAGNTVVIEEFLEGEEFSFMTFTAGDVVLPMELSRDYKRAYDGDKGLNTGGMGCFSPVPFITDGQIEESITNILQKTADAMVAEGCPFTGFLYGGLIATASGVKVIEFNARFGDPEAEVLLPRLESDLYQVLTDMLDGKTPTLAWSTDVTLGVIIASEGYPEAPDTGHVITGMDAVDGLVFHCGTGTQGEDYITAGGRVLMVVKKAENFTKAREAVYKEVEKIKCDKIFYRKDIGANINQK